MNKYLIIAALALTPTIVQAQSEPPAKPGDLTDLKLEDLLKVQVTTASRRAQNLSEVPAAISVLTQEDIRRSGLTSIPELLRLIPGMQVGQITSNRWAITARGFNNRFAPYLQVLVDGRSIYTLDFGGVYWDSVDMVIEDIERIEVLRGPQATLWGANAVNGVINIITKHSRDTQGQLATASVGSLERGSGVYRYGGSLGNSTTYRVFGKYRENGSLLDAKGDGLPDSWNTRRIGMRIDRGVVSSGSGAWLAMVEGYSNPMGNRLLLPRAFPTRSEPVNTRDTQYGYYALARWEKQSPNGANTRVQVFFDHYDRHDPEAEVRRGKADLDIQHQFAPIGKHNIIAGLGYRYNEDDIRDGLTARLKPQKEADKLYSSFIQDGILLSPKLQLIVGTRIDNNKDTATEWQPTARVSWTPEANRTVWAAISRAVRLPSRGARAVTLDNGAVPGPGGSTIITQIIGNPDLGSESVIAHELGFRLNDANRYSVDIATFYNLYKGLSSSQVGSPQFTSPTQPLTLPLLLVNGQHGESYGTEISGRLSLSEKWRLNLGYAYIKQDIRSDPDKGAISQIPPYYTQNQFQFGSHLALSPKWETDAMLFYVDRLTDGVTPAYLRFDARVGWQANRHTEVSLTLQNLFSGARYEFRTPVNEEPGRIPTSVTAKVVYRL